MKIKMLDKQVRTVLAEDEKSRNSDVRLTQVIWWKFYPNSVGFHNDKAFVYLERMFELPREDNIKRIRAKIQNEEKLYLPTDRAVAKRRGWLEDEWRMYLNKPVAGIDRQYL